MNFSETRIQKAKPQISEARNTTSMKRVFCFHPIFHFRNPDFPCQKSIFPVPEIQISLARNPDFPCQKSRFPMPEIQISHASNPDFPCQKSRFPVSETQISHAINPDFQYRNCQFFGGGSHHAEVEKSCWTSPTASVIFKVLPRAGMDWDFCFQQTNP